MKLEDLKVRLKHVPSLDQGFMPFKAYKDAYEKSVAINGGKDIAIAIGRNKSQVAVYRLKVHKEAGFMEMDQAYLDRFIKFLLWMKGGYKVYICGDMTLANKMKNVYSSKGSRAFDVAFMERVYENDFEVIGLGLDGCPEANEVGTYVAGDLSGSRIGFDAGGSDMKICAVEDGKVLYSEEIVWHPKLQKDPDYHYKHIRSTIKKAATYLSQVDAIGISSAGVYVENRCMVASLFILIEGDDFDHKMKDIYVEITKDYPEAQVSVLNDGDVAAVAGSMEIEDTNVIGIAMGTSEAVGFIDGQGMVKGWLNELAFAPVDFNEEAMVDEWSGDYGCGVKYFSQDGVIKLARRSGIEFHEGSSPAEKLKDVQKLMMAEDKRAIEVYTNIGIYLGHTLAFYYEMYEMSHVLLLGRVMSGKGGNLIIELANRVLDQEYSEIADKLSLHLPDEKSRRTGQSVAAASIPDLSS